MRHSETSKSAPERSHSSFAHRLSRADRYGYAGGFFLFWVYVWMGMAALGLALEAMITILTPRLTPFFLLILVRCSSPHIAGCSVLPGRSLPLGHI